VSRADEGGDVALAAAERGPATTTFVEVVMPTIGRPSLRAALAPLLGRVPIVVVDDRAAGPDFALGDMQALGDARGLGDVHVLRASRTGTAAGAVRVVRSGGRGPAAARNTGWRASSARWIAFLDDDVIPPADWVEQLLDDLAGLPDEVAASQGRIVVPLPPSQRPTDWERSTAGLQHARWATADMAYRRAALEQVGGFDERFPRAYREDADLGLRVVAARWQIVSGARRVEHPVRPAPWTQSLRSQQGNADDVLMRAVAGATLVPRLRAPAGLLWLGLTADFARRRITPGPRTPSEVATMFVTSAVLPVAATRWWLAGWLRLPSLLCSQPGQAPTPTPLASTPTPAATPFPTDPLTLIGSPADSRI